MRLNKKDLDTLCNIEMQLHILTQKPDIKYKDIIEECRGKLNEVIINVEG